MVGENPPIQKKSRSRSNSHDHNRSVSICNIPEHSVPSGDPSGGEADGECDPLHIKCIEQLLNDADVRDSNSSFTKPTEGAINPTHFKAYSEDLGETSGTGLSHSQTVTGGVMVSAPGNTLRGSDTKSSGNPKSIWLPSPSTFPLFFYQPSKSPDKMEVVAEQLNENLHLEEDAGTPPNI